MTGEHFGELSLFDGKPRMADVITTEPCDLLMLDHSDFVRCVEQSSRFTMAIMANLADRIRQTAGHLESHRELDVTGRVAEALLELLPAYGEQDPNGGTRITHKITLQQLAEQIGATRESVSRAITSLRETEAIRIAGRILIVMSEKTAAPRLLPLRRSQLQHEQNGPPHKTRRAFAVTVCQFFGMRKTTFHCHRKWLRFCAFRTRSASSFERTRSSWKPPETRSA